MYIHTRVKGTTHKERKGKKRKGKKREAQKTQKNAGMAETGNDGCVQLRQIGPLLLRSGGRLDKRIACFSVTRSAIGDRDMHD